jgi:lipoprotein NlpD
VLKRFSKKSNSGIDIAGRIGQKVRSAASGRVVYSGSGLAGYGNLLIIKHNSLYLSAYANNSLLLVKEGQTVKKGQVIAKVGRVGGHQVSLHFEIRKNGKPVNPLRYLPKK